MVSVIIAVYNPGVYLREALASVRRQHFQDFEVIIVDDESTEDVAAVVAASLPEARLIRVPRRGVSAARNVAFLEARGRYLAVLDQDDVWAPDKLARQVELMESDAGIGVCHTAIDVLDEGFRIGRRPAPGAEDDSEPVITDTGSPVRPTRRALERLLHRGICASSVMFRRDLLGVAGIHDPLVAFCEDWDLWVRLMRWSKIGWIPRPLVQYRRHDSNVSWKYRSSLRQNRQLLNRYAEWARMREGDDVRDVTRGLLGALRRHYASWMVLGARQAVRDRRWLRAAARIAEAGWLAPSAIWRSPHVWIDSFRTAQAASRPAADRR